MAVGVLFVVLSMTLWLRSCYMIVTVRGQSMEPSLRSGDRLLVRRADRPQRGDVAVLRDPGERRSLVRGRRRPDANGLIIKRVAALGGDPTPVGPVTDAVDGLSCLVPPGCVYVLGDNASGSVDSRQFGPVGTGLVVGIVLRRINQ